MSENLFQVQLSIRKIGGRAELVPPKILEDYNYRFIIVKEGGEEGIVTVEGTNEDIMKIYSDNGCKKLTQKQMEALRKTYPDAKIKKKFRMRTSPAEGIGGEQYELDENGERIVDTIQIVRSGFFLIDVPIYIE